MTGPHPARAEAAAALLAALRDVRDANERLQLAAAWVFDAFGDHQDAETIRMLPIGPARPGKPPVPPAPGVPAVHLQGGVWVPGEVADAIDPAGDFREAPADSVTGGICWCGHVEVDHSDTACHVGSCQCGGFDPELGQGARL